MEERRQSNIEFQVFIQKANDFFENTIPYRKRQDEKFDKLFDELKDLKEKFLTLPCPSRKQLWDAKMENIEKDSKNQWIVIGALWTTIGACAYSIFEAWIKLWNGGK